MEKDIYRITPAPAASFLFLHVFPSYFRRWVFEGSIGADFALGQNASYFLNLSLQKLAATRRGNVIVKSDLIFAVGAFTFIFAHVFASS